MITTEVEIALPTDEELERLADYLSGSMTAAETEAFDHDLATDAEFFYRMAPVMDVWYLEEPAPVAKETPTGVTLHLHLPAKVVRYAPLAAAASLLFMVLSSPVTMTVVERVAFGPEPVQIEFVHHPRQPRTVVPAPTQVRVAITTKKPNVVVAPQVVAVAEVPFAIDSLPSVGRVAGIRAETQVAVRTEPQTVIQWAPPQAAPKREGFGGMVRAVGDKLGEFWNKVRHPRTHKPGPVATPPGF